MSIIENLEDFKHYRQPLVLTIGNFDGMHRGHCAVLKRARELAEAEGGQVIVLTFSNHPSEILRPDQPIPLLCTLPHKLLLLEKFGAETIVLLQFSRYLAQHSARSFVERVRQHIPFSHLVLGHDATLGRDRQGDRVTMENLGMEWGFNVHYLEEYRYEGKPVSSTTIRELLKQGDLDQVEVLIERPYSIYGTVTSGLGLGKEMGYPTANIEVTGLCLPPYGVYAVHVDDNGKKIRGIANLGIAPTVREDSRPILEVHLFDESSDFTGKNLEVLFKKFLRPEIKFQNLEELRQQIERDIRDADISL